MIYQLPSGRIIHLSLEQYLEMTDQELQELNCLGNEYTSEVVDPFFKSSLSSGTKEAPEKRNTTQSEIDIEYEPNLTEISDIDKLEDDYFHPDDI
jgi:hypothetical protein|tara:strand:+ start:241 stop:525 length:285 start_codon:yes stop_codon:yes gene_type:complete